MVFPKLVPKKMCKTPIKVVIYEEGLSEDGEPIEVVVLDDLMCNFQDSAKTKLTADKKIITISGICLFDGDICPNLANISGGYVNVNGEQRNILKGTKARNPDGTVNYTKIELV